MDKGQLFFRALTNSLDKGKATGSFEGSSKRLVIPVDFNVQGDLTVADLVFEVTYDKLTGEQQLKELAEVYPNKLKKEDAKSTMELNSFLYNMDLDKDQKNEFESAREALKKQISFGKREINRLNKEVQSEDSNS